jgi:hypothetical protein
MSVILATWEAEIERISIQGQARQKIHETPTTTPITKVTRAKKKKKK